MISIPYGSIKSNPAITFKAVNIKFQFLMVRLKVRDIVEVKTNLVIHFNSLWFD